MTAPISRINRRRVLAGIAAAGTLAVTPHGFAAASPRAYVLQDDPGTTSFMNWEAMEGTPTEAAILAYQEQTGRTVEIIPTPGTGTDYETKVRTMLAGGTVPDIVRVNDDYVRFYSTKQQFTDLTPFIERDGVDPADYYQPRLIYYNVDMFVQ